MSEKSDIAGRIKRKAVGLGFSSCGFSPAVPLDELEPGFRQWLEGGKHGEMSYLSRNTEVRLNPEKLLEGAKTVISLTTNYYYPLPNHQPGNPRISRYAAGKDYHLVLKSMGHELLEWIRQEFGQVNGRVFTDSAPVFEREWARRSGLGWIGKNGCLILPKSGSWFFLAEIIVDMEVPDDTEIVTDRCGTCTRCVDACPTGALAGDGSMDPVRCISYLTIEHKSEIPDAFRGTWTDWIFGCDVCQDVCPWNRRPEISTIHEFEPTPGFNMDVEVFKNLDEETFSGLFGFSPVARAGRKGILRNFEFLYPEKSGE